MKLLLLDFESRDSFLSEERSLGPGWVYKLKTDNSDFKIIGWSIGCLDTETKEIQSPYYSNNTEENRQILLLAIEGCDGVIAHNSQYELGCLLVLGIDILRDESKPIYDTKTIATLYNNNLDNSLDALSKEFLPKEFQKDKNLLLNIVKKYELFKTRNGKPANQNTKTYGERAMKWAYGNMDILQEYDFDSVAKYCNLDVLSMGHLFLKMVEL